MACTILRDGGRVLSRRTGVWILAGVTLLVTAAATFAPRIAQPLSYHHFADQRSWLGIPNFGNVASNLGFAAVGLWGLWVLLAKPARVVFLDARERRNYLIVFGGMVLVACASSYYHLAPDNSRLVWDRLPMTIVFMALVAGMISERLSVRAGLALLPVLLVLGVASVIQWSLSEKAGRGDLRFYAAVQIYAVLVLLLILLLRPRYTRSRDLVVVVGLYALAKVLETWDRTIFRAGHVVSGHTLKHLSAVAAGWWILRMLERRRPVESPRVKNAQ
jgi:hypothetical protein